MKTNQFLKLGAFVLTTCLASSCVNEKYDLDNVDMTMGTSGDLTLPTSSTGSITLESILDLKEDGIIQEVEGDYFLVNNGSADVPEVDITEIKINRPVLTTFSTSINVDNVFNARTTTTNGSTSAIDGLSDYINQIISKIPHVSYSYKIPEDKVSYSFDNGVSGVVPDQLVELNTVSFKDNTTLDANLKVSMPELFTFANKVHFDNLTFTLPQGIIISEAEFVFSTEKDGVVSEKRIPGEVDEEKITFVTENDDNTIIDEEIHIYLTIDKAVTGTPDFVFENHKVTLSGKFAVNGTIRLETKDFDLAKLNTDQIQKLIEEGKYDAIRPTKLNLDGGAAFTDDVYVKSFSGKVSASAGNIAPISIGEMPDFLNDPEVVLDLANPSFFVNINFPLPADAHTNITLTGLYENGTEPVVVTTGDIVIPAESDVVFCISKNSESTIIPEKYADKQLLYVTIDNLNEIFRKIPSEIKVEVEDITMDIEEMPIPEKYDVLVDYMVFTPLQFGPDFKMVYKGTEDVSIDMSDIDDVNTKALSLEALVESNFPLNLTLSLDVFDKNGVSLKGTYISVGDIKITAHTGDGFTESPIALEIKPMEGHSIFEMLNMMDKIEYRAEADGGGDGRLSKDAYIKLKDIKITIKGGLSIDVK